MESKKEESFGIIPVFKNVDGSFVFCLIRHKEGHWGFPKGHRDIRESEEETAKRELKEETGISTVDFLNNKFFIEEYAFEQDGIIHDKSVKYFLGFVPTMVATTPDNFKKEISELKWLKYKDASELLTFPEAREALDQVFEYLATTTKK